MSQSLIPRRAQRRSVSLAATCRTESGMRDNGYISDISPHGCRLATNTLAVRIGLRIVIRPQGLEGLGGVVRWIEGQHAGIEFDTPLYEPVVDQLSQLHASGTAVGVSSL
ncbi:PilZ domain-containing protein [Novosphingobium sp. G106]|uniref:PilZ domain-containing protein n=1 Tax=Novosphingobium sp. G106 TaxID=2849500 RepID=UPI001C2CE794|nr:PilZ domain-containing protein [Novosphingobium sp. G106]MBV1689077.1 PilZ domain-containing protein [Novosphingobium sp. G106]